MKHRVGSTLRLLLPVVMCIVLVAACAPRPISEATIAPSPTSKGEPPSPAPAKATKSASAPTTGATKAAPAATAGAPAPAAATDVLYHDTFTDSSTGWPEAKFDNYFIGYHEPEYYHIEIDSPNSRAPVFVPGKKSFIDATVEVKVQVNSKKTATDGDFAYGVIFRRSGDQYYAFAVSARGGKWMLLKSSPTAVTTLASGTDDSLHQADADDSLRVDAQGAAFALSINDRLVARVHDADYAAGEIGFYVQTFDAKQAHIHFDDLTIRQYAAAPPEQPQTALLLHDDFTDPSTGWPAAKFDNYFIGYHEPEYFHVEIDSPNSREPVFAPDRKTYGDSTMQLRVQVNSKKTATEGDFVYGLAFRRAGENYYAFAISPRSGKWELLKSSPNALTTLAEGMDGTLHAADADDVLRVDAQGSTFWLHINGRLVAQIGDADYASGEAGFYAQTLDSPQAHIHFDDLGIYDFEAPRLCTVTTNGAGLNMRSGPGTSEPFVMSMRPGDSLEPLGKSLNGQWLNVNMQMTGETGWVSNTERFISCNTELALLPVIVP